MYTILVILIFKVEGNDFISFWQNKLWKMRNVLCQMSGIVTQKCYCMAGKLLFLFPTTLDKLRTSSQVFSNKFIAIWLTKILTCTVSSQYLTSNIILKNYPFFLTTKNTKFNPCCHTDILVQATDTLESQFWGICFFSWYSTHTHTQNYKKCQTSALQQSMTVS